MKIEANSIEELIECSGELKDVLFRLDKLIQQVAPNLEIELYTGKSITMIGYGKLNYENKNSNGVWPLISIAPQKNYVSIYVTGDVDGRSIVDVYKAKLGKVNLGKRCIRVRNWNDLNIEQFIYLIKDVIRVESESNNKFGRNCAKPINNTI